jgi:WD40 repeat protein
MTGDPQKIISSKKENNVFYLLFSRSLHIVIDGKSSKDLTLGFEVRSLELNENNNEIYLGDCEGNAHVYDLNLNFVSKHKIHYGEISVLKLSHDEKLVASGDNKKQIMVWSASSKEVVCDRFAFHSAKVYDIDWSADDLSLVSGSLDRSVILWSLPEKTKKKVYPDVDIEVVTSVKFVGDTEFICGGHSCALRKYQIY